TSAPRRCSPSPPDRSYGRFQPLLATHDWRFRQRQCCVIVNRFLIITPLACFAYGLGVTRGQRPSREMGRRTGARVLLGCPTVADPGVTGQGVCESVLRRME